VVAEVDPIKGVLAFLRDRMRVSIFHQVLQNGEYKVSRIILLNILIN
jgi:hypothetical protein